MNEHSPKIENLSKLPEESLSLVRRAAKDLVDTGVKVRIVLDESWDDRSASKHNALTIVVKEPGWTKRACPQQHFQQAKKEGFDYLIVLGRRALTRGDVELVITVAHELEHVRQECATPGIRHIGDAVFGFIQARQDALRPEISGRFDVPLEYHAEAAAALYAAEVLGQQLVQEYYEQFDDYRSKFGKVARDDLGAPELDLARFLKKHWAEFTSWYQEAVSRGPLPSLEGIEEFVGRMLRNAGSKS